MGNCSGSRMNISKEEQAKSREIDTLLRKEKRTIDTEIKLLLLGAGESGKSTIAKQMKIIYLTGFSDDERTPYREIIHSNVLVGMRSILMNLNKNSLLSGLAEENQKYVPTFLSNNIMFEQELTPELTTMVKSLWNDPFLKKQFAESSDLQAADSASYYFDSLDRIAEPTYVPSEQDVLRCRTRTTGVTEICFPVQDVKFRMVDVGGQRSERKKWIMCFQDVTAVLFCVAMSEYDLKLFEDDTVIRMHESLMLFEEICNCPFFADTALILFLNKSDIFREKIQRVDLNVCFAEYTGGCNYDNAVEFLRERFKSLNKNKAKPIYHHITCATDTGNITFVFSAIRDIILRMSFAKSGI